VLQLLKLPDGTVKVLVEGAARASRSSATRTADFHEAEAEPGRAGGGRSRDRGARALGGRRLRELREAQQEDLARGAGRRGQIDDYSKLADTIASHLAIKIPEKQEMLATLSVKERLEKAMGFMEAEISVLQVEKRIRSRVKRQMEKTQREYYLNEQMKAIQKELGEGEDGRDEAAEIEERIKKTKLTKEAREKARPS
jgi:ATP-dependent Lon protease